MTRLCRGAYCPQGEDNPVGCATLGVCVQVRTLFGASYG